MVQHEVNIGARVRSRDGKKLGSVEQLIVHPEELRVDGFILGKGFVAEPKIVEADLVAATDKAGIALGIDAKDATKLPTLVHQQRVKSSGSVGYGVGFGQVDVQGSGDQWFMRGASGGQLPNTGSEPFFMQAPIGNIVTEDLTNLDPTSVTLSEGTDVVGSDGKKVGHVDEVYVEERHISGILVRAGWLFRHDVVIPRSQVAGLSHKHVRLNVTADEAERLSHSEEG